MLVAGDGYRWGGQAHDRRPVLAQLLESLPSVPMDAALRAIAGDLFAGLADTAGRVTFELALLASDVLLAQSVADTSRFRALDLCFSALIFATRQC